MEVILFEQFLETIQQHVLNPHVDDFIPWRLHSSRILSTKSFCNSIENLVASTLVSNQMVGLASKGLASPHAEILACIVFIPLCKQRGYSQCVGPGRWPTTTPYLIR